MEIRKDLDSVSSYITRLLALGSEFSRNDVRWSHLKNEEDFERVYRVEVPERHKLEKVYADGRDIALYMSEALLSINHDFSRYPTLSSIIDGFAESWVYGRYDTGLPAAAEQICEQKDIRLWSVEQMIELFKQQEKMLAAVRVTLDMLKSSDLYKNENGLPIMKDKLSSISVSGVTGSSINILSPFAIASVSTEYTEPEIFSQMIAAIKSQNLPQEEESKLIDNTQLLATSHQNGTFVDAYKDFMQNVSAHITVFAPFLPALASMI